MPSFLPAKLPKPELSASVPSSIAPAAVASCMAFSGSMPLAIASSYALPEAEENVNEAESAFPTSAAARADP